MDRRTFVLGAVGLAVASVPAKARSTGRLVSVERPKIVKQQCAQWCWAAAASMIFNHLGHRIDQTSIVAKVYDGLVCAGARPTIITEILNVPWIDDDSHVFTPQIEACYDQSCGVDTLTSAVIIDELEQDRMLLYANTRHCMAVAGALFVETAAGPKIMKVIVMDPSPEEPDERLLSDVEMRPAFMGGEMTYLAAVRV